MFNELQPNGEGAKKSGGKTLYKSKMGYDTVYVSHLGFLSPTSI